MPIDSFIIYRLSARVKDIQAFAEAMRVVSRKAKVQILRLRHVPIIDATGLHTLRQLHEDCRKRHVQLILLGVHSQSLKVLKRSGLYELIGEKNIVSGLAQALSRTEEWIKVNK